MRVVYVLSSTVTTGGASKSFLAMLKGLMARGIHPTVVLPDTAGLYKTLSQLGIETIILNYRFCTNPPTDTLCDCLLYIPRLAGRLYLNWRASVQLAKILEKSRPDIIHTNVSVIDIGCNAAEKLKIPHIYHIREYGDLDFNLHYIPSHHSLERSLERHDSYSICITKDIQRHHKQDGKRTSRVIYNGIAEKRNSMLPTAAKDYFLFAGRIEPAKGLALLLEAYAIYTRRTVMPLRLLIAGSSPNPEYTESMKKAARENETYNIVEWLGERNDTEQLMRNAIATVIPSRFEGFGRVMPEAMFNSCLVIGRDTGGTKEQMDSGLHLTGGEIALRFDSAGELADRLLEVASKPADSFDDFRERAFRTVNTLYTTEANADGVYQMYKDILKCTD